MPGKDFIDKRVCKKQRELDKRRRKRAKAVVKKAPKKEALK